MFECEAHWFAQQFGAVPTAELSPLLSVGLSGKPYVDGILFEPLRGRGVQVVHLDIDAKPGVDIVADALSDDGLAAMRAIRPRAVLLANVLEHVLDPTELARRCYEVLEPGGRLYVSVPRDYPHHRAPIDTMFRPTPDQIADLVPDATLSEAVILTAGSYWDVLRARPWVILRQVLRAPFPFLGWARYKRTMSKLKFLVKPYLVSCAVLR